MKPTVLYRLYDATGALLYVGISGRWARRMVEHAQEKPWFADVSDVQIERFPTGREARAAELRAIRSEGPRHNVADIPSAAPEKRKPMHLFAHVRGPGDVVNDICDDADGRPSLTMSAAATWCRVSTKTIQRRLRGGNFPNAWQDRTPGQHLGPHGFVWRIPVVDLEAAGLQPISPADTEPHTSAAATRAAPSRHDRAADALRAELSEYRRRAEVAEALATERGNQLARADRYAQSVHDALMRWKGA